MNTQFNFDAFIEKANNVETSSVLIQIKGGSCDECHHAHYKGHEPSHDMGPCNGDPDFF